MLAAAAVEHFHRLIHQLAKPASADEAHDHRGANGAFPTVDRVGGEFFADLRNDAVKDGQWPAGTVQAQGAGRGGVD